MVRRTIASLAAKHPYYTAMQNYDNNEPLKELSNWQQFYDEYKDADKDRNFIFRFDIKEHENSPGMYYMEIGMIQQRIGRYLPIYIHNVYDADADKIYWFLRQSWQRMKLVWRPFHY